MEYKKKTPKDFCIYKANMIMVIFYGLTEEKIKELIAILDDPILDEWDFKKILDQDKKVREIFGVPEDDVDRQLFSINYSETLKMAVEEAKLMSN
jgi:hypothetical protein